MSIIHKLFKLVIIVAIILFTLGIADYFLVKAGIISVDTSQLPEFLQPLFQN